MFARRAVRLWQTPKKLREQLQRWLFTGGGSAPWEWTELQLCRDVYHCTPAELRAQDWETIRTHMALLDMEAMVSNFKAQGRR